jgi:RNA polymerase sigma-70 factor, ECF subfamily
VAPVLELEMAMQSAEPARERALVLAAAQGDEDAFRRLIEPHRAALHRHCYRMLGSVHDADDALQEGLLRAWRGLGQFEGRSSLRSWLFTIATNASLRLIERRPTSVLPIEHDGPETSGAWRWIEPYPDEAASEDATADPELRYDLREGTELAFIAALQHLPARQRAALILRDTFGFSAREVAAMLHTTVASANGVLQRARAAVAERLPDRSQQATLRTLGDRRLRKLVDDYVDAMERGDVDAVVGMLVEDATWSMPPNPVWYSGHTEIASFLIDGPLSATARWRHLPTRANGQLAVAGYLWDPKRQTYLFHVLDVLTLEGARIKAITAFLMPVPPRNFGLPEMLPIDKRCCSSS